MRGAIPLTEVQLETVLEFVAMNDVIPVNMRGLDRLVRIALGALVFSMYFVGPKSDWALLGLVPIATGVLGYCPIYGLLGMRTTR